MPQKPNDRMSRPNKTLTMIPPARVRIDCSMFLTVCWPSAIGRRHARGLTRSGAGVIVAADDKVRSAAPQRRGRRTAGADRVPRKLIAGNWKMNGLRPDGVALARAVAERARGGVAACDLLVCPPATLLFPVGDALAGSGVALG